jgi:hypothetical protein
MKDVLLQAMVVVISDILSVIKSLDHIHHSIKVTGRMVTDMVKVNTSLINQDSNTRAIFLKDMQQVEVLSMLLMESISVNSTKEKDTVKAHSIQRMAMT